MTAIQAALTFLSTGNHLITSRSLFGSTMGFVMSHLPRFGIEVTLVPQTDTDAWCAAVRPNTKMLFV